MTYGGHSQDDIQKARSVLLELAVILQPFWDRITLVGGWSAYLLATHCAEEGYEETHVGSKDVDLVFAIPGLSLQEMRAISELLESHGYRPAGGEHPAFRLERTVDGARPKHVLVDLMVPGRRWAVERVMWMTCLQAGEMAREYAVPVLVSGVLPNGEQASATINVAGFPAFITFKGLALGDHRRKHPRGNYEKHAYDIAFVIYACGPQRVAAEVQKARAEEEGGNREDLKQALAEIGASFGARDAGGAEAAAVVYAQGDPAEIPRYTTQAFEAVAEFLEALGLRVER